MWKKWTHGLAENPSQQNGQATVCNFLIMRFNISLCHCFTGVAETLTCCEDLKVFYRRRTRFLFIGNYCGQVLRRKNMQDTRMVLHKGTLALFKFYFLWDLETKWNTSTLWQGYKTCCLSVSQKWWEHLVMNGLLLVGCFLSKRLLMWSKKSAATKQCHLDSKQMENKCKRQCMLQNQDDRVEQCFAENKLLNWGKEREREREKKWCQNWRKGIKPAKKNKMNKKKKKKTLNDSDGHWKKK